MDHTRIFFYFDKVAWRRKIINPEFSFKQSKIADRDINNQNDFGNLPLNKAIECPMIKIEYKKQKEPRSQDTVIKAVNLVERMLQNDTLDFKERAKKKKKIKKNNILKNKTISYYH